MPAQPNVFKGNDGKVSRYNLRKFAELPFHLIGSARTVDLCDHVLFNYYWLHAKISAVPILNILEDFTRALSLIHDPPLRRQVWKSLGTFTHCLKITQNVSFANFSILAFSTNFCLLLRLTCLVTLSETLQNVPFWLLPSIFVLLKLTCVVTLFDRKLQVSKNSPKLTMFWHI